ncbi:MAG: twin-arginine translocase TatA/TatE family subunit [Ignavibacteria bacterium]
MGNLGAGEIILIILVILIFFGPKKIPEIAQGIGKGMKEFKRAMKDVEDELKITGIPKPAQTNTGSAIPETATPKPASTENKEPEIKA